MGSIIVRIADGSAGYLCATASGENHTDATDPSTYSITIKHDSYDVAWVRWQKDTEGNFITNSPMLQVMWGNSANGAVQSVLFSSSVDGKRLASWKVGTTNISTSFVQVNSGQTIEVSSAAGGGSSSTVSPSDIGIQGYYYANNGLGGYYDYNNGIYTYNDSIQRISNQGNLSNPAYVTNEQKTEICFKYNGAARIFVFMLMRGWDGRAGNNPGSMGIISGSGPIVNSVFQTDWASGYDDAGHPYRMDVFAISGSGMYPSITSMAEHRTDGVNNNEAPDNSTWIKQPAESLSMAQVTYYDITGTHILRSKTETRLDLNFTKPVNSTINFYKDTDIYEYVSGTSGTKVIPDGQRFIGWYKRVAGGAETGPHTTQASLGKVQSTSSIALRIYYEPNSHKITYHNSATTTAETTRDHNTSINIVLNGGSHKKAPDNTVNTSSNYSFLLTKDVILDKPTKPNHKFIRWEVNGNTFTAQWERLKVTVSFNKNGGGGSMSPVEINAGDPYAAPNSGFTPPAKKRFIGWGYGQGNKRDYKVGETIPADKTGTNFTLYAIWADFWRPCLIWIYNKPKRKWERYITHINEEDMV